MALRFVVSGILTLVMSVSALAADRNAGAWKALREGDAVLMMRHALAPGTGDPVGFKLGDCSTQRNLNDAGQQQARAWKPFLAERGITDARVFSSQWCRCMDTAMEMNVGEVSEWPSLNSFFQDRGNRSGQTLEVIAGVNAMPAGPPVILVSHQVNTTALTGIFPSSNEGVIIALPLSGSPEVLARVSPGR